MKSFPWHQKIHHNILLLKITGLWPNNERYLLNLYTLYSIFIFITCTFAFNLFVIVNLVLLIGDLDSFIRIIYSVSFSLPSLIKACCLVHHMPLLRRLMDVLRSELFQPQNKQQESLARDSFRLYETIRRVYLAICGSSMFFSALNPVQEVPPEEAFALPLMAWYPWSVRRSPNYELTYGHQVIGGFSITIIAVNVDLVIGALSVYMGAQLEMLEDAVKHALDGEVDRVKMEKLVRCVLHHRAILRFAETVNHLSNWIIFSQYIASGVNIACILFLLSTAEIGSGKFITCLLYISSMIMELFIYCWFGNEVKIKSRNLLNAAYYSNWIDASQQIKKLLLFFMLRCSKPLKMSSLNLFSLSVETFMKLIKTAWSYFALLNQLSDK